MNIEPLQAYKPRRCIVGIAPAWEFDKRLPCSAARRRD
jgi:hypothetical protein